MCGVSKSLRQFVKLPTYGGRPSMQRTRRSQLSHAECDRLERALIRLGEDPARHLLMMLSKSTWRRSEFHSCRCFTLREGGSGTATARRPTVGMIGASPTIRISPPPEFGASLPLRRGQVGKKRLHPGLVAGIGQSQGNVVRALREDRLGNVGRTLAGPNIETCRRLRIPIAPLPSSSPVVYDLR
jgi:hypothetical protein